MWQDCYTEAVFGSFSFFHFINLNFFSKFNSYFSISVDVSHLPPILSYADPSVPRAITPLLKKLGGKVPAYKGTNIENSLKAVLGFLGRPHNFLQVYLIFNLISIIYNYFFANLGDNFGP